eukprot:scaffold137102_cov93-Phaeocystis_antarctica.AAC.1
MGDHDALMKALEDGAWLELKPPTPTPTPNVTPTLTPTLTLARREAGRRGREDAHGLALGGQVRPGRRHRGADGRRRAARRQDQGRRDPADLRGFRGLG